MFLAALLDAGADLDRVQAGLSGLDVGELRLERGEAVRHGITATRVEVHSGEEPPHRTWADVRGVIERAGFAEPVEAVATRAFALLAQAEGRIHGVSPEEVYFHEVGAADAIADICGVAIALDDLGIDRVECSPLPASRGVVTSAHGRVPLPAPAALELLKGAAWQGTDVSAELVTPTGAALVAALAEGYGPLPRMRLEGVGYGAGARDLEELPNVLRVLIGAPEGKGGRSHHVGPVSVIETNLDDISPELIPDALESCFAAGALDVWTTPVVMKKGRPGFVLAALARPADEDGVARAMLEATSTLGVRISRSERWELDRRSEVVDVAGGQVRVKLGLLDGEVVNVAPEHDDLAEVARRTDRPVSEVWRSAIGAAYAEWSGGKRT